MDPNNNNPEVRGGLPFNTLSLGKFRELLRDDEEFRNLFPFILKALGEEHIESKETEGEKRDAAANIGLFYETYEDVVRLFEMYRDAYEHDESVPQPLFRDSSSLTLKDIYAIDSIVNIYERITDGGNLLEYRALPSDAGSINYEISYKDFVRPVNTTDITRSRISVGEYFQLTVGGASAFDTTAYMTETMERISETYAEVIVTSMILNNFYTILVHVGNMPSLYIVDGKDLNILEVKILPYEFLTFTKTIKYSETILCSIGPDMDKVYLYDMVSFKLTEYSVDLSALGGEASKFSDIVVDSIHVDSKNNGLIFIMNPKQFGLTPTAEEVYNTNMFFAHFTGSSIRFIPMYDIGNANIFAYGVVDYDDTYYLTTLQGDMHNFDQLPMMGEDRYLYEVEDLSSTDLLARTTVGIIRDINTFLPTGNAYYNEIGHLPTKSSMNDRFIIYNDSILKMTCGMVEIYNKVTQQLIHSIQLRETGTTEGLHEINELHIHQNVIYTRSENNLRISTMEFDTLINDINALIQVEKPIDMPMYLDTPNVDTPVIECYGIGPGIIARKLEGYSKIVLNNVGNGKFISEITPEDSDAIHDITILSDNTVIPIYDSYMSGEVFDVSAFNIDDNIYIIYRTVLSGWRLCRFEVDTSRAVYPIKKIWETQLGDGLTTYENIIQYDNVILCTSNNISTNKESIFTIFNPTKSDNTSNDVDEVFARSLQNLLGISGVTVKFNGNNHYSLDNGVLHMITIENLDSTVVTNVHTYALLNKDSIVLTCDGVKYEVSPDGNIYRHEDMIKFNEYSSRNNNIYPQFPSIDFSYTDIVDIKVSTNTQYAFILSKTHVYSYYSYGTMHDDTYKLTNVNALDVENRSPYRLRLTGDDPGAITGIVDFDNGTSRDILMSPVDYGTCEASPVKSVRDNAYVDYNNKMWPFDGTSMSNTGLGLGLPVDQPIRSACTIGGVIYGMTDSYVFKANSQRCVYYDKASKIPDIPSATCWMTGGHGKLYILSTGGAVSVLDCDFNITDTITLHNTSHNYIGFSKGYLITLELAVAATNILITNVEDKTYKYMLDANDATLVLPMVVKVHSLSIVDTYLLDESQL